MSVPISNPLTPPQAQIPPTPHPISNVLLFISLVLMIVVIAIGLGFTEFRSQAKEACRDRKEFYATLHGLIVEVGKPGGTGKALDELVIPPGTDPQLIDILAQLAGPEPTPKDPAIASLEKRLTKRLGKQPQCN